MHRQTHTDKRSNGPTKNGHRSYSGPDIICTNSVCSTDTYKLPALCIANLLMLKRCMQNTYHMDSQQNTCDIDSQRHVVYPVNGRYATLTSQFH